jgi:uncharacterized protein YciI
MKLFFNTSINLIKHLSLTLLFLLVLTHLNAQSPNPKYDKNLADSLGADDYGMKMYVLVILKTGTNKIDDKQKSDSLFAGHMKNIDHLAEIGKLIVAGPMSKNDKEYRGIFILNVKTIEDAKILLDLDPAIKAKLLDAELYRWYGSAALPLYLKSHDVVKKKDF